MGNGQWDNNPQQAASPTPLPALLSVEDPDWGKYQSDDPAFFLAEAGRAVRKFCGWHIFPNITEEACKIRVGSKGIVLLPSRLVTDVECLALTFGADDCYQELHPHQYTWYKAGWLQLRGAAGLDWAGGYYYGPDGPSFPFLSGTQPRLAKVVFKHGYETLPEDVKGVCFELAEQAMVVRSGNVKQLESPGGYRAQLSQNAGLSLNDEQRNRLSSYRIGMVG